MSLQNKKIKKNNQIFSQKGQPGQFGWLKSDDFL
jgi:hypothetical protein